MSNILLDYADSPHLSMMVGTFSAACIACGYNTSKCLHLYSTLSVTITALNIIYSSE